MFKGTRMRQRGCAPSRPTAQESHKSELWLPIFNAVGNSRMDAVFDGSVALYMDRTIILSFLHPLVNGPAVKGQGDGTPNNESSLSPSPSPLSHLTPTLPTPHNHTSHSRDLPDLLPSIHA